jgi:hypothetical protein
VEGFSISKNIRTEESANGESPKTVQWCDLSCFAACFIVAGIIVLGMNWWTPPPYAPMIRDLLGCGLLIAGFFFAWKWCKENLQKPKMD